MPEESPSKPQKISLSFGKKSSKLSLLSKKKKSVFGAQISTLDDTEDGKTFITGVSDKGIQSIASNEKELVIPLSNEDKVISGDTLNQSVSDQHVELKRKLEETSKSSGQFSKKKFGLQVMRSKAKETKKKPRLIHLIAETNRKNSRRTSNSNKLNLDEFPDEAGTDEYEKIPVEEYGPALLRGMGWVEGESLGTSGSVLAKPVEFKKRPDKLGLGAEPMPFPGDEKSKSTKD